MPTPTPEQAKSWGQIIASLPQTAIVLAAVLAMYWISTQQTSQVMDRLAEQNKIHQENIQSHMSRWADSSDRSAQAMEDMAKIARSDSQTDAAFMRMMEQMVVRLNEGC